MEFDLNFTIDNNEIGLGQPVYFIADIAANHDGDIKRAKDLIFRASEAGANAAKFQHFQVETIVSDYGFKKIGNKLTHQSKWKKSVSEVYKNASVSLQWTEELKKTCDEANITFFSTPYSLDVIDHLDNFIPAYKIGSGDITWKEMIEKVATKDKPFFIASGASNLEEVKLAVNWGASINSQICLMQCNTNYTAEENNFKFINLNVLHSYKKLFPNLILGLSDHTPRHSTVLGAVALGAKVIEKHFTDNNSRIGPDHEFSMDPSSWKEMVDRTRELEHSLGDGEKRVEFNEVETAIVQRRALRATKFLKKGSIIKNSDFTPLRPCPSDALPLKEFNKIIGKEVKSDFVIGEYLRLQDL